MSLEDIKIISFELSSWCCHIHSSLKAEEKVGLEFIGACFSCDDSSARFFSCSEKS